MLMSNELKIEMKLLLINLIMNTVIQIKNQQNNDALSSHNIKNIIKYKFQAQNLKRSLQINRITCQQRKQKNQKNKKIRKIKKLEKQNIERQNIIFIQLFCHKFINYVFSEKKNQYIILKFTIKINLYFIYLDHIYASIFFIRFIWVLPYVLYFIFYYIIQTIIKVGTSKMQQHQWEVIGDFKVSKSICLGKGQSCEVYYGYNTKTGEKVAAKKIDINKITAKLQKQLQNEIKNLRNLTSPFIVRLLGYYRYDSYLYLFLEYCQDLDLKRYLEKNKKKSGLCQAEALMFMRYIIEGYKELYNNNIIHRDIKPANILMKQGIAKLSDFGFSRVVPNPENSQKFTLLGTPLYTAPEILRGNQFSSKCDVWSVGVVFYQMLYGRTPWTGQNLPQLKQNILNKPLQFGQLKRKQQIKDLLRRMLTINSKQRITWKQIFEHSLFKDELPKNLAIEAKGYTEYKNIFLEYVKTNIVKSYLRFDMTEVKFKQSYQPTDINQIAVIKQIQNKISHRRNIAFMFAYMLVLYYKNVQVLPPNVNQCMEFQYALVIKAYSTIANLGSAYFYKQPQEYDPKTWAIFKASSSYEQLKKVLTNDYKILQKMLEQMKYEADKRYKQKKIPIEVAKWFTNLDKNPDQTFIEAMNLNLKQLSNSNKKGVCGLLAYYIDLGLNKQSMEENDLLDFGSFYQQRQRAYGLN